MDPGDEALGTSGAEESREPEPGRRKKLKVVRKATAKKAPSEPAGRRKPSKAAPDEQLELTPQWVNLGDINADDRRFQARFENPDRTYLQESIEKSGHERPIDLWPFGSSYVIIDGFGRFEIVQALGRETISALIHKDLRESEAVALSWRRNGTRKNLSPLEKANWMWRMLSTGEVKANLPQMFGVAPRTVDRYLSLLSLPENIKEIFDGNLVKANHAKVLAKFGIMDAQKWKKRIVEEKLSSSQLRKILAKQEGNHPIVPSRNAGASRQDLRHGTSKETRRPGGRVPEAGEGAGEERAERPRVRGARGDRRPDTVLVAQ